MSTSALLLSAAQRGDPAMLLCNGDMSAHVEAAFQTALRCGQYR
jgi:hypothetical protein